MLVYFSVWWLCKNYGYFNACSSSPLALVYVIMAKAIAFVKPSS
jgi:hypothetical protein